MPKALPTLTVCLSGILSAPTVSGETAGDWSVGSQRGDVDEGSSGASAPDLVENRLFIMPRAEFVAPFGELSQGVDFGEQLGSGLGLSMELSYGLSRTVALGAWGTFRTFLGGDDCGECTGKTFAGGPFIRYHLVQGTRLDPWLALGLGFENVEVSSSTTERFFGPTWLRAAVGADWYLLPWLNLGPSFALSATTFTHQPALRDSGTAIQFMLGLGLGLGIPPR